MKFYSPLRYPGGKNRLANFIERVCVKNNINGHYIEPYAGGASVALSLLMEKRVSEITINDKDRSIYAFWYSVLYNTNELCKLIVGTAINISNWRKQKEIQKQKSKTNLLDLGFSTFFLNRTNISGIINGGVIGGIKQEGKYKIDCRFNKKKLTARIKQISKFKDRIHLYNLDTLDLIEKIKKDKNNNQIIYFDPPYYIKGESLYLNAYTQDDHEKVAYAIQAMENCHWIITYDNTFFIKRLYKGYKSKQYNLCHMAYKPKIGKEIMFISHKLLTPKSVFSS